MSKLLKLSDTPYIVVDDSEIQKSDKVLEKSADGSYKITTATPMSITINNDLNDKFQFKITHSTEPIERYDHPAGGYEGIFDKIKQLPLSEVEEAIYGFSVKNLADNYVTDESYLPVHKEENYRSYINGFKAHQELVKDKLFTVADMINAFVAGTNSGANYESLVDHDSDNNEEAKEFSQNELEEFERSLLPKTEWDVEFDERGKIKLL